MTLPDIDKQVASYLPQLHLVEVTTSETFPSQTVGCVSD